MNVSSTGGLEPSDLGKGECGKVTSVLWLYRSACMNWIICSRTIGCLEVAVAVLVEAISVIVRVATIDSHFKRGLDGYKEIVPNATFCTDGRLTRVGFMAPPDAAHFGTALRNIGLNTDDGFRWIDMALVSQLDGPTMPCDWLQAGKLKEGPSVAGMLDEDLSNRGTAFLPTDLLLKYLEGSLDPSVAKQVSDDEILVACPIGWTYEGSLSEKYWFTPTDEPGTFITNQEHGGGPISKSLYLGRAYSKEADDAAEITDSNSQSRGTRGSTWSRWRRAMKFFRN